MRSRVSKRSEQIPRSAAPSSEAEITRAGRKQTDLTRAPRANEKELTRAFECTATQRLARIRVLRRRVD